MVDGGHRCAGQRISPSPLPAGWVHAAAQPGCCWCGRAAVQAPPPLAGLPWVLISLSAPRSLLIPGIQGLTMAHIHAGSEGTPNGKAVVILLPLGGVDSVGCMCSLSWRAMLCCALLCCGERTTPLRVAARNVPRSFALGSRAQGPESCLVASPAPIGQHPYSRPLPAYSFGLPACRPTAPTPL